MLIPEKYNKYWKKNNKRSVEIAYMANSSLYKDFDRGSGFVKGCVRMIYYYKEKYILCYQITTTLHFFIPYN